MIEFGSEKKNIGNERVSGTHSVMNDIRTHHATSISNFCEPLQTPDHPTSLSAINALL